MAEKIKKCFCCGKTISKHKPVGRPLKYCSARCRLGTHRAITQFKEGRIVAKIQKTVGWQPIARMLDARGVDYKRINNKKYRDTIKNIFNDY